MITYLKSNQFPLFMEKRLAFVEGAGGKGTEIAAGVTQALETATEVDMVAAAVLQDEKVLWSENAENEEGAVNKFIQEVTGKIDGAIPDHLTTDKATEEYEKLGGDAGEGKGAEAKTALEAAWVEQDKAELEKKKTDAADAARKKVEDEAEDDADPVETKKAADAAAKAAADGITEAEAPWNAEETAAALPQGMPAEWVDRLKKECTSRDATRAACDKFDEAWKMARDNAEAAKKIEEHKVAYLDRMTEIAVTAVQEHQKQVFDAARVAYIGKKVPELVPELTEAQIAAAQAGIDAAAGAAAVAVLKQQIETNRVYAAQYLSGHLSSATLQAGEEAITKELDEAFGKISADDRQAFLSEVALHPDARKNEWASDNIGEIEGEPLDPSVRAYVQGLAETYDDSDEFIARAKSRIALLPPEDRNNVDKVRALLATTHMEDAVSDDFDAKEKTDADREAIGDNDPDNQSEDNKEMSGRMTTAANIMEHNPDVVAFFEQRIGQANHLFEGKPNHKKNLRRYRIALMAAIGQLQANAEGNILTENYMQILSDIEMPSTYVAGAAKIDVEMLPRERGPKGLKPAEKLAPGTGPYAMKLLMRLRQANAAKDTVIKFRFKGETYYGRYTGDNLVIYVKPEAPKPAVAEEEKPVAPAEESNEDEGGEADEESDAADTDRAVADAKKRDKDADSAQG